MKRLFASVLSSVIGLAWCTAGIADEPDYDTFAKGLSASSGEVNQIGFSKSLYSIDEAQATEFFRRYLADHRLTAPLRSNLGYPLYYWGDNHANLQRSIATVYSENLLEFFAGKRPQEIARVKNGDKDAHNHYFYMLAMVVDLLQSEQLADDEKQELAKRVFLMLQTSRLNEERYRRIDLKQLPILNLLKAQLLLACFSYAVECDRLDEFKDRFPQPGRRGTLLREHDTLVIDNDSFDETQLGSIQSFLAAIPPKVITPTTILCYDLLVDRSAEPPVSVHKFAKRSMGFNIFSTPVGSPQNQFPEDYQEVNADLFTIVIAHEYNHGVDAQYIQRIPQLRSLKEKTLAAAGTDPNNYLRRMFDKGFFQQHPQEFVASIANMYFCSTADTLQYALQKARQGNHQPMTQFMLMASVYSSEDECFFYRIDEKGTTAVQPLPCRKTDGLLTQLTFRGQTVRLEVAEEQVTGVSTE